MSNKPTVSTEEPRSIEVFDTDEGHMIVRDEKQRRRAQELMRMVEMATFVKAIALKHIADDRHYLDFGCSSFKEFAETMLPVGYRSAHQYVQIGRKFAPMVGEIASGENPSVALLEEKIGENDDLEEFGSMGLVKLHELTKIDDEAFEDVVREGRLVMPDGETEYTLEELKAMKTREYSELMKQARMDKQAYQARIAQLEEEKKKLASEREADHEKIEEADRKLKEARELERLYAQPAATYEQQDKLLEEIDHHVRELRRRLFNIGLDGESARAHQNKLVDLIREIGSIHSNAQLEFSEVINAANDTIEETMDYNVEDDPIWDEITGEEQEPAAIEEKSREISEPDSDAPVSWKTLISADPRARELFEDGWQIHLTTEGSFRLENGPSNLQTLTFSVDLIEKAVDAACRLKNASHSPHTNGQ